MSLRYKVFLKKESNQVIKYRFTFIGKQVLKDGELVNFFENFRKLTIKDTNTYCSLFSKKFIALLVQRILLS